jgi:hypothetical protein
MAITPELQKIVSTALISGCEVTLSTLISALEANGMALDQLDAVRGFISEWSFELIPLLTTGDFATARILRARNRQTHTAESVALELRQGEMSAREYKSSLFYDHQRAASAPGTPIQQLRSDKVLFSSLKTVAAFLNTSGGVLFVGVKDDAQPIGLREDCAILGCADFDPDQWQLAFRSQITGKFKDGSTVNDYVEVEAIKLEQCWIARVQVLSRKRLSFLKHDNGTHLYRRQGNRTMEVLIDEVEDFLEMRREQRQE